MGVDGSNILLPVKTLYSSFRSITLDEENFQRVCKESIKLNDFLVKDHIVFFINFDKNVEPRKYTLLPISTEIKIISKNCNIDTNIQTYTVSIFNGSEIIEVEVSPSILTSVGIKELLQYGCVVSEKNTKILIEYLTLSSIQAPIKYFHSSYCIFNTNM